MSLCSVYILCTLTLVNLSCRCSQITLDTQNRMVGEVKGRPLGSILAMTTQGTANSTDSALRNLMSILWYSPLKPSPAFTQKLLLVIVFSKSKSDHHSFPNKLELLFHYSLACRVGHIMQQLFFFLLLLTICLTYVVQLEECWLRKHSYGNIWNSVAGFPERKIGRGKVDEWEGGVWELLFHCSDMMDGLCNQWGASHGDSLIDLLTSESWTVRFIIREMLPMKARSHH